MGNQNSISGPEEFVAACASNRFDDVQTYINSVYSERLTHILADAKDKDGKNCLIITVIYGHEKLAELLLRHGADVHVASKGGTALHEAAARRNQAMVELLLRYGADPFLVNAVGETPMESAVVSGAVKIVRLFEMKADFAGKVDVQWNKLGGLAHGYRKRHVVVLPYRLQPINSSRPSEVRRQIWIHGTGKHSILPKCRMWLDGATAYQAGLAEAVLRLHPSFSQPVGKVFTRFCQGYCLFIRRCKQDGHQGAAYPTPLSPADSPLRPSSSQSAMQAAWTQLLHLCNVDALHSSGNLRIATFLDKRASSGSPVPAGSLPQLHLIFYSEEQQVSYTASNPVIGLGREDMTPLSRHARVPMDSLFLPQAPFNHAGATLAMEAASALPGESDQEFAARLAAIALTVAPETLLPTAVPSTLIHVQPLTYFSGLSMHRAGFCESENGSYLTATTTQSSASGGGSTALSMPSDGGGSIADVSNGGSGGDGSTGVYAPSSFGSVAIFQQDEPSDDKVRSCGLPSALSSAPPLPEEPTCVICLSAPPHAGFLHGATVHRCVCVMCSLKIKVGDSCPMCRVKVEKVLDIF
ncbi:hypothetical protein CEUSTIGMA_g6240.t1 [Chlamydomonas eustigma]|uniref:Uncharacterized protein n=1 Tax=Chlamydomonas eustigma TaxID=1157962 RepID=A0A250X6T5_9CHLO|nr:hypothetical protein CEUSTIGMA_g6240.t1 [Chlamydomonas eustigma]|eukprot:GAX78803.1 hypothetical protein CEUSTIGMA_g6240.t1 [Chlamydomonas eustigma]